jgi:hypothetical protein
MDIDDPSTTELRNEIIQTKPLLKSIYEEWYDLICKHLPDVDGPVLELGSGAGFLRSRIPTLITSEIFPCRNARLLLDGQSLPFRFSFEEPEGGRDDERLAPHSEAGGFSGGDRPLLIARRLFADDRTVGFRVVANGI